MKVNEIFYSIQGEAGPMFGKPCIFIRTSGCNLKCTKNIMGFNCDTPYHIEGKEMKISQIIKKLKKYPTKNIILTGGESLIQKDIDDLVYELGIQGYNIQIETNGFQFFPDSYIYTINVCSPKQNLPKKSWFFNPENIRMIDYFKFVFVNKGKDILKFIKTFEISKDKVFIMPEGITRKEILRRALPSQANNKSQ